MQRLALAALVALALAAGACAGPAKDAPSGAATGKGEKASTAEKRPWWRLSQYSRKPKEKPWVYGDVRPGKGLLSNDEDGFVLMREGEGRSSDPTKPSKVRR